LRSAEAGKRSIIHFDDAWRIYTALQLEERRKRHLRYAGKAGVRTKVFRIDQPLDLEAFSLIAQAFFVWNRDLATYFSKPLLLRHKSALKSPLSRFVCLQGHI